MIEYEYGQHCGDENCHACGTQRYNCDELNKLDNIPGGSQTGVKAIEVDIKKEIAIGKADMSSIKSEEVKGKVNNKLDKLKKLRRRNGR